MGLIKHSQVFSKQMNESHFKQGLLVLHFFKFLLQWNKNFISGHKHKMFLPLFAMGTLQTQYKLF